MAKRVKNVLHGMTLKFKTGCGNIYVTINYDDEKNMIECFCKLGKSGGCSASQLEGIGRLVCMNSNDLSEIVKQLAGIRCNNIIISDGVEIVSCCDAIAKAIKHFLEWRGQQNAKQ